MNKVDDFEDIPAIISLARPGPKDSGMKELYVRRKKGETWNPLRSAYEKITEKTYGVMVYQEQMMRAMVDLAGFSNSDADRIRKVIGKKRKAGEFEPYREAFLTGCEEKKTLNEKQANEFWQGLLEWAHYGFNRAHAVEYGLIGYWTAWVKANYPVEFYCAQLTYGADKENTLKAAQEKGFQIITPKVGVSDPIRWIAKENNLYMPFIEIKGIGEKEAEKCSIAKNKLRRKGFFELAKPEKGNTKAESLLHEIKAFDSDPKARPNDCLKYFQYDIGENACVPEIHENIIITKTRFVQNDKALNCRLCELRSKAKQVVPSSAGLYNALILCEAPGQEEDEQGIGLVGDAGKRLWKELLPYGINRRIVHIGNCCKCFPDDLRTPKYDHIDTCFNKWMLPETLSMDCRLILACGNVPLYALTGRKGGIQKLSGEMEWVEKVKAWTVWCVHPSSVLRNPKANMEYFQKGIERFAKEFEKGRE